MLERILSLGWLILGIGLIADGIYEIFLWGRDPMLQQSSLSLWHSTGIVPGALAIVLSLRLGKAGTFRMFLGYSLATALILYVLYIFAITPPEARVRPLLALQLYVLILSISTIVLLWKKQPQ
jgi:hypothetical protein